MDKKFIEDRRGFLKQALSFVLIVPSVSALTGVFQKAAAALPAGQKAVEPSFPMAKALNYRKATDAKKCQECQFYTKVNGEYGKCQIIQPGLVHSNWTCNSWAKRK